jgi:hypothetical protein
LIGVIRGYVHGRLTLQVSYLPGFGTNIVALYQVAVAYG